MILIIAILIISIAVLAIFDNDKRETVMQDYCNSECTEMKNKKYKFCC